MNSVRKLSEPSPGRRQLFPKKKKNRRKTLQLLIPHLKAHI
jgi:hypothetical protein